MQVTPTTETCRLATPREETRGRKKPFGTAGVLLYCDPDSKRLLLSLSRTWEENPVQHRFSSKEWKNWTRTE
ncbi:hypothetical protein AOLI_G00075180 [Acnodon oligacanthus]